MSIHRMMELQQALNDAFDPEYCERGSVLAIRWDAATQVLSFQGHEHCVDVWFGVEDNGDIDVVVELNLSSGSMNPQTLWEAP